MSEPKPDATCRTCANWRDPFCAKGGAAVALPDAPDRACHVRPTPCPPPGFFFTKRDGSRAQNVPMNERQPGSPWAWPVCPRCDGSGWISDWNDWREHLEKCSACSGTGALRPAGKQHEVKR